MSSATKPAGTMTKNEIRAAITALAAEKIAAGMPPEQAVEKAGAEFRAGRQRQAEAELAHLERWLAGSKTH